MTLILTSPHTKSVEVKAAQARLVKTGFLAKGDADGEFGPVTATAAKAAKWSLGYSDSNCTLTYGHVLDAYLSGKAQPNLAMQARAKLRKRLAATESVGAKAADRMVKWAQAGWKENPMGSNKVPQLQLLSRDLRLAAYLVNMGQAWCAQGAMTAALAEGSKTAKYGLVQGRFDV
jgi:peptidoglycan hydrolase-like protein with peptidoglycan-binding domain